MNPFRGALLLLILVFFFSGLAIHYDLLPEAVNFLPELLILGMFAGVVDQRMRRRQRVEMPGFAFALFLVVCTVVSAVACGKSWAEAILFLRLLVRFYVMFLALVNSDLSEDQIRWFLRLVVICMLIQVPTAAIRLPFEGQGERAIGTYAYRGGGSSTAIPMVAAAYLLAFYLVYRKSPRYLVGIIAFVAFGLIGGKRAIFLAIPLTGLMTLMIVGRYGREKIPLKAVALCGILFLAISYVSIRTLPGLNPEHKVGGSFDLAHVEDHATSYTSNVSEKGETGGRFSTTMRALDLSSDDLTAVICGLGPGTLLKSRFSGVGRASTGEKHGYSGTIEGTGIRYGITGFVWLLVQIGYPGTIVWLAFYGWLALLTRRMAIRQRDPFWRAYYFGLVGHTLVVLLISLTYGSYMLSGDLMTFLYFMLVGLGFRRWRSAPRQLRLISNTFSRPEGG